MKKNISINHLEMRLIVPLVLGIMFGLGDEVSNPDGTILQGKVALLVKIVFFCTIFTILFYAVDRLIARLHRRRSDMVGHASSDKGTVHRFFDYRYSAGAILKNAVAIIVCWLPYIIWMFPGV